MITIYDFRGDLSDISAKKNFTGYDDDSNVLPVQPNDVETLEPQASAVRAV